MKNKIDILNKELRECKTFKDLAILEEKTYDEGEHFFKMKISGARVGTIYDLGDGRAEYTIEDGVSTRKCKIENFWRGVKVVAYN